MPEQKTMAAVVYQPGEGDAADAVLAQLAVVLRREGVRLAGTVQRAAPASAGCRCDMLVLDLSTGVETSIAENRGPEARGCRLDTRVLETLVGATQAALDKGADLLVINRFGKRETEGAGFRQVIGYAAASDSPTLVAINRSHLDAWRDFAGDLGTELPPRLDALASWFAGFRSLAEAAE